MTEGIPGFRSLYAELLARKQALRGNAKPRKSRQASTPWNVATLAKRKKDVCKDGYKACGRCKKEKLKAAFYKRAKSGDGLDGTCMDCRTFYNSQRSQRKVTDVDLSAAA